MARGHPGRGAARPALRPDARPSLPPLLHLPDPARTLCGVGSSTRTATPTPRPVAVFGHPRGGRPRRAGAQRAGLINLAVVEWPAPAPDGHEVGTARHGSTPPPPRPYVDRLKAKPPRSNPPSSPPTWPTLRPLPRPAGHAHHPPRRGAAAARSAYWLETSADFDHPARLPIRAPRLAAPLATATPAATDPLTRRLSTAPSHAGPGTPPRYATPAPASCIGLSPPYPSHKNGGDRPPSRDRSE